MHMSFAPLSATAVPPPLENFARAAPKWGKQPQPTTTIPTVDVQIRWAAAAAETPADVDTVRAASRASTLLLPDVLPTPPSGSRPQTTPPTGGRKDDKAPPWHVERKTSANAEEAERQIPEGDTDCLPSAAGERVVKRLPPWKEARPIEPWRRWIPWKLWHMGRRHATVKGSVAQQLEDEATGTRSGRRNRGWRPYRPRHRGGSGGKKKKSRSTKDQPVEVEGRSWSMMRGDLHRNRSDPRRISRSRSRPRSMSRGDRRRNRADRRCNRAYRRCISPRRSRSRMRRGDRRRNRGDRRRDSRSRSKSRSRPPTRDWDLDVDGS